MNDNTFLKSWQNIMYYPRWQSATEMEMRHRWNGCLFIGLPYKNI
jgi:hypothetical protein